MASIDDRADAMIVAAQKLSGSPLTTAFDSRQAICWPKAGGDSVWQGAHAQVGLQPLLFVGDHLPVCPASQSRH
jgi:hypothetical protein